MVSPNNILQVLRQHKKIYLNTMILCVALSIAVYTVTPKEYFAEVILADEMKEIDLLVGLSNQMAYINRTKESISGNSGILHPDVYKQFLGSETFLQQLCDLTLPNRNQTLMQHISHRKRPIGEKIVDWFSVNSTKATEKERAIEYLKECINYDVSFRLNTTKIQYKDQDPIIAAQVTDSIVMIFERTIQKTRAEMYQHDLERALTKREGALRAFKEASDAYNRIADSNADVTDQETYVTISMLSKERDEAFSYYNDACLEVQRFQYQKSRNYPIFTILCNATTPQEPFRPKFLSLLLAYLFIGLTVITWGILLKMKVNLQSKN